MKEEEFMSKIVKVGERGQIVIPKLIRKRGGIKPKSLIKIVDYGTGNIMISKIHETKSHEERFFEILSRMKISKNAWDEIQKERARDR